MRILVILMLAVVLLACGGLASAPRPPAAPPTPQPGPRVIETTDLPPSGELPPGGMLGAEVGEPASAPVLTGPLSKDEIRAVMQGNQAKVRYCYERELVRAPSLAGTVVVKFVIRADGGVASANVASSTVGSPAVEQCITNTVMKFVFPPPKGGGIVVVSYPYKLQTTDAVAPPR